MRETTVVFLPEELLLGIAELDAQHERLFAELALLKSDCLETNRFPSGPAAELLLLLREHFATEERLANAASIPFAEHAWKHEEVLVILTKAFDSMQKGGKDVFGLLRYIDYWFERHISETDRRSYRRLAGRSAAMSVVGKNKPSAVLTA